MAEKHKIIMLGGRRAGKSTILSSILYSLQQTPGNLCTIIDKTDYTGSEEDGVLSLEDKRYEVQGYINNMSSSQSFTVDMTPTRYRSDYTLQISCNKSKVDFEFSDVPGEWMNQRKNEYNTLKELIKESDVFVVAIDTPYLMEAEEGVNKYYNRIADITSAMSEISDIEGYNPKRLVLLCPVKCEKWFYNGEIEAVTDKVKRSYKDLINILLDIDNMNLWIMPLQTVGGIEFERFLPARIIKKSEDDAGKRGSIDEAVNLVKYCDGSIARNPAKYIVENDPQWTQAYGPVSIPLSWYKVNGKGLTLNNCEQPGYHILKFLVSKEEEVIKEKANKEKNEKNNSFWTWLFHIFDDTFGEYLPIWKDLIDSLKNKGLIREYGQGFAHINQKIE